MEELKKNKKIPLSIKNQLWFKYFGKEKAIGICNLCKEEIHITNFHTSHKISRFNNGSDELENLIPLCKSCNLSMGKTNYDDYKLKYHNKNIIINNIFEKKCTCNIPKYVNEKLKFMHYCSYCKNINKNK